MSFNRWGRYQHFIGGKTWVSSANLHGMTQAVSNAGVGTSTAWPAANLAIFIPFLLDFPFTVAQIYAHNGATASGNIDVGVYAEDSSKLVSAGSTAQAGTSAIQAFNVTDTYLAPGVYYFAVALDNTTATMSSRGSPVATIGQIVGFAEMASAFPLPAIATLASFTRTLYPAMGCVQGTVL